jgi:uncharacterized repeat protein (TIGR03803 family)
MKAQFSLIRFFLLCAMMLQSFNSGAQSVTLVSFNYYNGAGPQASLTLGTDGNFYGTTYEGGSSGVGTVFKMTTNGNLTTLVNFNSTNGEYPEAGLTLGTDGNFYGTTYQGGSGGYGTVFKMTTNGSLTTLVNFNNSNGVNPKAGLTLGTDGNFYGTTDGGGSGYGTVFKMTTNGSLTTLVNFGGANGAYPESSLTLGTDGNFYGTTYGGSSGVGTVFKMTTNGSLTTLVNFGGAKGTYPKAGLTLGTDGNFYGTTAGGGSGGYGTVFTLSRPVIITQPQSQAVLFSHNATFTVMANSALPLAYQWYFSNANPQITAGAVAQTLSGFVYGVTLTNGGAGYTTVPQVQFIGGGGSGASGTATVSNGMVTAITMTNAGSGYASLPAVVIDPPNGLLIGQTNTTLTLNAITTNNAGNYFVIVANSYGNITSSVATLTVLYPPSISQQPQSQTVDVGTGASFKVTAAGTSPFGYQWWMTESQMSNATAVPVVINGFVLAANMTSGGAGYQTIPSVQFLGGSGSGASGTAVVSNRMVTAITMTNAGSGYATPPTIQIAAPTAISLTGQTNSVLAWLAVANTNAGNYYVVVTNNYGSITSSIASLIVVLPGYNQISNPVLNNGKMCLSFVGISGGNYALDRSFSLSPANWIPQITNPADANGNLIFTNTPDSTTNNFWRIRSVP